jgi:hypothetical protein
VLTAKVRSVGTKRSVDLSWSGATTSKVDVRRNDAVIARTPNDGAYTDSVKASAGSSYRYRVTQPGGSPTSNEVTVTF